MDAKRRFVAGALLVFACLGLLAAGRIMWSSEKSTRRTTVVVPTSRTVHEPDGSIAVEESAGRVVTTGHDANHLPAFVLFGFGAAAGLVGVVLVRSDGTAPADQAA